MSCLRKRKRKNGSVWLVDYYDNEGNRHWFNTHTSSRRVAEKMKAKIDVDLTMGTLELPRKEKPVTLGKLVESYLKYSEGNHSPSTYKLNRLFLKYFLDFTGDVSLKTITRKNVEDYKLHRNEEVSKTSVNMEIRHLKAAFSYAIDVGKFIKENPFKEWKQSRLQYKLDGNNLPKYLSLEEIEKLFKAVPDPNFKDLIFFYLHTGCRREEALNLTWQNIYLDRKKVKITKTKGKKDREIPLNDKLLEVLERRKSSANGEKLFTYNKYYVTHKFREYADMAGLNKDFTVHSLRHTFASHLVMSGVPLYSVKELLGHSSIKVTEMYAHLAPDYLAAEVTRLPY